jgi:serine protease Do
MIRRWIAVAMIWGACAGAGPAAEWESGKKSLTKLMIPVVAKATDATVRVRVDNKDTILGTVVATDGYILTKGSELRANSQISVRFRDGTEYDANYVGYHEASDLALLKVDASDLAAITKFAPAKEAIVGNWVATVGFESEPVAVGVIGAGARRLYREEAIIDNFNKGFLGITAKLSESEADEGVEIETVTRGAAAAKAGIKVGDVILQIEGKPVRKFPEMRKLLEDYRPGDSVKVVIRRDGEEKTLSVKLSRKADFDRGDYQNTLSGALSARRTGFPSVIMHDSVIKPQDCGGPIVDLEGRVLGLNIARAGRIETWALPAEVINRLLPELKNGKHPAPARPIKTEK